jgi:hypothetical protein
MPQPTIDLTRRGLALGVFSFLAVPAAAHAPPVGRHGGRQVDAGPFHLELVQTDERCAVFVTDHGLRVPAGIDRYDVAVEPVDGSAPCRLKPVAGEPGAFETTDEGHLFAHGDDVVVVIARGTAKVRARFTARRH